ncbi:MAG: DUF3106 domain-containing protein [Gammaproteobacteria bacterium]|nr:DUF3106 domain-containing protein [Gammaproteobacteria bacterium]MBU1722944.1 DUF3106 domain-containing protein [Gammaproteobacteria bacterium]MBU2005679.1 DUF3106 domain-containing protein [Gammaproteobacteria bacterium]
MKSTKHGRFAYLFFGMAVLLSSGQILADPVKWSSLKSNEQAVLKPFAAQWDKFPESKQKVLRRWAAKSPAERALIRQRYGDWSKLSAERKQTVAKQLNRYKQMPDSQRKRLQAWHKWVKKLPVAEQQKLKKEWPGMNDAQRKAYMKALQQKYGNR